MNKTMQHARSILEDAYGRTQGTPDGLYCRVGRIDRAYTIAARSGAPRAFAAVASMVTEAEKVFARADRALARYGALDFAECDCPSCRRIPTFGGDDGEIRG